MAPSIIACIFGWLTLNEMAEPGSGSGVVRSSACMMDRMASANNFTETPTLSLF
jgi:hypothetical protein